MSPAKFNWSGKRGSVQRHPEVTVIYDGDCRFCLASLAWLKLNLQVASVPFQEADLNSFGLTRSECEKSVFVVTETRRHSGASAVGSLLTLRGNSLLGWLTKKSGRAGEMAYRWLASHRSSLLVRLATIYLERVISRRK